jgi:Domain of unknown function (DUF4440)
MRPAALVGLVLATACASGRPTRGAVESAPDEIASLLNEFLAKVDDPAMHERFWAGDLVYVSAAGLVRTKADILKSMRAGDTPGVRDRNPDEPKTTFSAEEVKVRPLGADIAVLNFRLVQHAGDKTNHFRNSGTFAKRNGQWQAVSWQATREQPGPRDQ